MHRARCCVACSSMEERVDGWGEHEGGCRRVVTRESGVCRVEVNASGARRGLASAADGVQNAVFSPLASHVWTSFLHLLTPVGPACPVLGLLCTGGARTWLMGGARQGRHAVTRGRLLSLRLLPTSGGPPEPVVGRGLVISIAGVVRCRSSKWRWWVGGGHSVKTF